MRSFAAEWVKVAFYAHDRKVAFYPPPYISDNFDYGAALSKAKELNAQAGIDYKAAFEANKQHFINQGLINKANANTISEADMKKMVDGAMERGDKLKGSPNFVRAMPGPLDKAGIKVSKAAGFSTRVINDTLAGN
jgi:hypothetical protein